MLACLVLVAAAIAIASFAVKPSRARSFDLFYGTMFIDDDSSPVAVDLASGKPTVRLRNAFTAVSAKSTGDLDVTSLQGGGTLMLNPATGEFNMVDASGFVIKTTGGGVRLPTAVGATTSRGVPSGGSAFIVQSGEAAAAVYLVGPSTVASAIGENTRAKPRAYATLPTTTAAGPGAEASADGALWLLTGTGTPHTITRLTVPVGSNAGVALEEKEMGTVSGVSAVGAATSNSDGSGGDAVAVASARALQVFSADGHSHRLSIAAAQGVDSILPASNQQGRFEFLYHSASGWSLVSAPADGAGPASVDPLDQLDPALNLVAPAASRGLLYTMDTNDGGHLWQIDPRGSVAPVAGASTYPVLPGEQSDLSSSKISARGSRVIFNSRADYEAEAVFTDDSHAPSVIDKHAAALLDANGATPLTDDRQVRNATAPPKGRPKARPAQAINDKVNCRTTTQIPHIPVVQLLERGSRSARLQWAYPLLDTQDCAPSTYTVSVKLRGSDAPQPPSTVTVQGQDGVNLAGLFPDTEYQLTVTAYINGRGTPSAPLTVRTSLEGPAAPSGIHTSGDDRGNWTVSWNSCGGVQSGCVPTASWQIIPKYCDGSGFSTAPATRQLLGDPTQHSFRYTYAGNDDLLGRGLTFQIEGIGSKGTIGTPTQDHGCSYSWSRPVAGDISVSASAPPPTTGQSTTRTTVSVRFARNQTHDLGGAGGRLTYELLSGTRVVTKLGPTTRAVATLGGVSAGQRYQVAVVASPPRHPDVTAVAGPVDVQPAVALWPAPTVTASFANSSLTTGTLRVQFDFPAGTDTHGERFDLAASSSLDCGNAHLPLSRTGTAPSAPLLFPDIDRSTYNSVSTPCTVSIQLAQSPESATDPPLYGAGESRLATSGSVPIDAPSLGAGQGDFTATFISGAPRSDPQAGISYNNRDPLLLTFAQNWSTVVLNAGGATCATVLNDAPPTTVHLDKSCVKSGASFTVTISFDYFGSHHVFAGVPVQGSAPQPIDAAQIHLTATWATVPADAKVNIQYTGSYDDGTLSTLQWTETVTSSGAPGVACATATEVPTSSAAGIDVHVDLTKCPPSTIVKGTPTPVTWTLDVSFTDPNYGTSGDYKPPIGGTPPQ